MLTIAIQAGGQSRRMGEDKALLTFLGKPLISRVIERVAPIAHEILVTTNSPHNYQFLGVPLYPDLIPDRGALGGLHTALSAASQPLVAVIACDMPFINRDLLAAEHDRLVETGADMIIPHTGEGLEPFHAIYRREVCLPHIAIAIQQNKWRVDSWFSRVKLEMFPLDEIKHYDPQLLSFQNVNTPEELQGAINLAKKIDAT
jgi:molybdopterin-guanine dinucleotide biosynthesis protein A